SMSGLTSQPNFNSFLEAMKGHKRHRPMNTDTLNAFSNYWENVREYYYPFESDMKAGTAEVYKHEIPGGQYSNLKPQAQSLGLLERMDEIKQAYADANELFGDIVKVTPSSKVVGDLAMFMVSNHLTKADVQEKASSLSFPDSVKGMLRGDLGQPDGGWPDDLQKKVLKGEKPYTDLPNKHLKPLDFEKELKIFREKYDEHQTECDFLSYSFYPKVFDEYYKHLRKYGQVTNIPTPAFLYGLENGEEVMIEIERGKTILVRLLQIGDADEEGVRTVFFKLNGQNRFIEVKDNSVNSKKISHTKANGSNQIGTPLQGILSRLFVKEGDTVKTDAPLFTIEAMKMESTITSSSSGRVKKIWLPEATYVEAADLIVELE
ncbi:MAG TPA: biotin/lipoyl-containing protein, partial [Bacteroidia bacterium]|nr:biotin/lipoyl-containing protein [Bacteroidia bacterium]